MNETDKILNNLTKESPKDIDIMFLDIVIDLNNRLKKIEESNIG